jgi:hypothetical protein
MRVPRPGNGEENITESGLYAKRIYLKRLRYKHGDEERPKYRLLVAS